MTAFADSTSSTNETPKAIQRVLDKLTQSQRQYMQAYRAMLAEKTLSDLIDLTPAVFNRINPNATNRLTETSDIAYIEWYLVKDEFSKRCEKTKPTIWQSQLIDLNEHDHAFNWTIYPDGLPTGFQWVCQSSLDDSLFTTGATPEEAIQAAYNSVVGGKA